MNPVNIFPLPLTAVLAATPLLLVSMPVNAGQHSHHHSAHIHGVAELNLAIEENQVGIHFIAPADSLVGFEYQAKSNKEIAQYQHVKRLLNDVSHVVQFNGGNCQQIEVHVDASAIAPVDNHHKDEHAHSNTKHEHEHQHRNSHGEISVNYLMSCTEPHNLMGASLTLFSHFSAIEKVQTTWLGENNQGSHVVNASNNAFKLK